MSKLIISLFDYTGIWSQPYVDAGYQVERVDIQNGRDIYHEQPKACHGVLMAPPCTHFSYAGTRYWQEKDQDGRTEQAVRLVRYALQWIQLCDWWALENPPGRLAYLVPELGKPQFVYDPYDFGDPRAKRTLLWGQFTPPVRTHAERDYPVKPNTKWIQKLGGESQATKNYRSATSLAFARAWFLANP